MFKRSLEKHVRTSRFFLVPDFIKWRIFKDVPVELTALINDTTGTLIASHYVNPRTKIAVIFGTGCNAAYMERIGSIPKIKNLGCDDNDEMAINCEWVRALCRVLMVVH